MKLKGAQRKAVETLTYSNDPDVKRNIDAGKILYNSKRLFNVENLIQVTEEGEKLSALQKNILYLFKEYGFILSGDTETHYGKYSFVESEFPILCNITKLMQKAAVGDIDEESFYNKTKQYLTWLDKYKNNHIDRGTLCSPILFANFYGLISKLISNCHNDCVASLPHKSTSLVAKFFSSIFCPEDEKHDGDTSLRIVQIKNKP